MKHTWLSAVLVVATAAGAAVAQIDPVGTLAAPTKPIEKKYYQPGPHPVAQFVTPSNCDGLGNPCDIYYPSNIQQIASDRPIITWANGTSPTPVDPETYGFLLRHLASWGFVVVATRDGATAPGQSVIAAARYAAALDRDHQSPLFHHLATDRIGAMGHSQGAMGAIHAMLESDGYIHTAVAFHLPQYQYCNPVEACFEPAELTGATAGSIFFVSSHGDTLISPDVWPQTDQLNSNTAYYEATPEALTKVKAMLIAPNHNDVQGKPTCGTIPLCVVGSYRYLGYPTAWMKWQLEGASDGPAAFRATGEIAGQPLTWTSIRSNVP